VPFEGPAAIAEWVNRRGHTLEISRLYGGDELPSPEHCDQILVMGGPMGVHDLADHPWLAEEKAFLREAIAAGKHIVGVCLGAQLLADVLGGRVYRGAHKEIGWFPIDLTDSAAKLPLFAGVARRLEVFHWHGDTFDLPSGALHLASSPACMNQAFLYDERILGLQFHVESTPQSVRQIIENCGEEIEPSPYVQSAEDMRSAPSASYDRINQVLWGLLDRLSGLQSTL
jgi:GMP synthase-like glutamine amidotransferase